MTLETVQAFLIDNDEDETWFQSFADTNVTEAIKTYETKQLRKLKARFQQSHKEAAREKLINQALSIPTTLKSNHTSCLAWDIAMAPPLSLLAQIE
ncbi:hypothetical protein FH508_0013250 [Lysinibacillus sp. CD3-6]|uniref:hypothetical protein n=1 Tax=Lysinibacillus sp. CD3-6 TaxID=2892541 RepID=UPI00116AA2C3|nr:hypothetical protein [Lysinibacillus sp. CD3-6]UED78431.1 hypothetical protein FH508_0013250 [Lysinibacillus sp. CD3-6]